jgi:hypothetical protein
MRSIDYDRRTRKIKTKYGSNAFQRWGRRGGNPVLLRTRQIKQRLGRGVKIKWTKPVISR